MVDAISSGRVELSSIAKEDLPASIQVMSPEEQKSFISKTNNKRNELEQDIKILAEKRNDYLREKVEAEGGKSDSLDAQIYESVRAQAKSKGLIYDQDSARY